MSDPDLTLYSDARFYSLWVLSVWVTLKEKNLPFRCETVDLERGEHRTGDYRQRSLNAKVPSLRHGDFWLSESLAIVEYLEEVFAAPRYARMLPADPAARARDRQILSWLRTDFAELRRAMPFEGIFDPSYVPGEAPAKAREEAQRLVDLAAARLSDRGGEPSWADFELAFMLRRLVRYDYDLSAHAPARAFCDSLWQRPSMQSWVALKRPFAGA